MFTNPMGEGLYLQNWTYFIPGFWPVQIALEAGFIGLSNNINAMSANGFLYFLFLLGLSFTIRKMGFRIEVRQ
jgi:hypothetical protein